MPRQSFENLGCGTVRNKEEKKRKVSGSAVFTFYIQFLSPSREFCSPTAAILGESKADRTIVNSLKKCLKNKWIRGHTRLGTRSLVQYELNNFSVPSIDKHRPLQQQAG